VFGFLLFSYLNAVQEYERAREHLSPVEFASLARPIDLILPGLPLATAILIVSLSLAEILSLLNKRNRLGTPP
jgi:hypothetical protein